MDPRDLLSAYDDELRTAAEVADADELVRIGPLWLATFPARGRGFITYRGIAPADDVESLVAAAVEHYRADERVDEVEWKTRGHDGITGLDEALQRHGFVLEDPETVMVGSVDDCIGADDGLPAGYRLERADDDAAIREAEALAGRVFGDTPELSARRGDELVDRIHRFPGSYEMWAVRGPSGLVCSGRVDFVDGTGFAGLWGGACDPAHRGRGLYRALTGARARSAREHGKSWVQSDCTEFSRPILERAGLVAVTTTTPAVWHR